MNRPSAFTCLFLSIGLFAALPIGVSAAYGAEEEPEATEETKKTEETKEAAEKKEAAEGKEAEDAKGAKAIDLTGWESEDEKYTNPIEAEVVEEDGKKQLKITFKGGEKDKSVVCKPVDKMKLPGKGILHLSVMNPNEKAFQITVALKTGKNWAFHESQRIEVAAGKEKFTDVAIDLTASTFKSEATEWKNTGTLANPGEIKSLQLAVYNGKEEGTLIVAVMEVAPKP